MNYNGPFFVEVTTYYGKGNKKEKDMTGRLSKRGDGWQMTQNYNEAYRFTDLEEAKAVRGAWQYQYPDHISGVIGEPKEGENFRYTEPGYNYPPTLFDEEGKAFYHQSDTRQNPHSRKDHCIQTETCIWCGEDIPTINISKHEEECSN